MDNVFHSFNVLWKEAHSVIHIKSTLFVCTTVAIYTMLLKLKKYIFLSTFPNYSDNYYWMRVSGVMCDRNISVRVREMCTRVCSYR